MKNASTEFPVYRKVLHFGCSETQLFFVVCDEGWREQIVCEKMYEWAADWLIEQIQGRQYASGIAGNGRIYPPTGDSIDVRNSRIANTEAGVLFGALESISRMLHGSWDNACSAMGIADKAIAGWRGLMEPPRVEKLEPCKCGAVDLVNEQWRYDLLSGHIHQRHECSASNNAELTTRFLSSNIGRPCTCRANSGTGEMVQSKNCPAHGTPGAKFSVSGEEHL